MLNFRLIALKMNELWLFTNVRPPRLRSRLRSDISKGCIGFQACSFKND